MPLELPEPAPAPSAPTSEKIPVLLPGRLLAGDSPVPSARGRRKRVVEMPRTLEGRARIRQWERAALQCVALGQAPRLATHCQGSGAGRSAHRGQGWGKAALPTLPASLRAVPSPCHDTGHAHVPPHYTPKKPRHLHLVPGVPLLLGGRESPASQPDPESLGALLLLVLHMGPWRRKTLHVTAGLANWRDSQCLGLPSCAQEPPWRAHCLLAQLSAQPAFSMGPLWVNTP